MKHLVTPISQEAVKDLQVGDIITISGWIYTGRDAVLPKLVECVKNQSLTKLNIDLEGAVMFHTAVSPAGVGPTSSNKKEIEESIVPLSEAGLKIHLGKGEISQATIDGISKNNAIFAVIPPTTALFTDQTKKVELVGWPELGMEALHRIYIDKFQAIVACAHGKSIYSKSITK